LPPPRRRRRLPFLFTLLLLIVLVVAGVFAWVGLGPGPGPREGGAETTVVLKRGQTLPEISETLADAGVIRLPFAFALLAKLTHAAPHLHSGEYSIPARASTYRILTLIREGKIVRHVVVVPEGLSSAQVADLINNSPVLSGDPAPVAPEGAIMPATYEVQRGDDRTELLHQMTAAQTRLVRRLWADRARGLPYRSPQEALALASIVEKETALAQERPHVAGVYLNRLAIGMKLESDPTIIYGITAGRPLGRGLTHADVIAPTAWNTYVIAGLPPTPIANPGKASIEAALNPDKTKDLYFVADGTGGHVFAQTFEEHEKNVVRWRAIAQSMKGQR
jgi:UPF0755 protein